MNDFTLLAIIHIIKVTERKEEKMKLNRLWLLVNKFFILHGVQTRKSNKCVRKTVKCMRPKGRRHNYLLLHWYTYYAINRLIYLYKHTHVALFFTSTDNNNKIGRILKFFNFPYTKRTTTTTIEWWKQAMSIVAFVTKIVQLLIWMC